MSREKINIAIVGLGFGKEFIRDLIIASIPLFRNKPHTPQEWKELRELRSIRPGDLSATQRARLRELMK